MLRDPDVDLRIQAALALGEQQYQAAVAPLLGALEDPDPNVRFHVIEALGRLRATVAAERLMAIAESGDFFLGFAALDALASIGDKSVAPRVVALFGSQNLALWRPAGSGHELLQPPLPCRNCVAPHECVPEDSYRNYCVRNITVEAVANAVLRALRNVN